MPGRNPINRIHQMHRIGFCKAIVLNIAKVMITEHYGIVTLIDLLIKRNIPLIYFKITFNCKKLIPNITE